MQPKELSEPVLGYTEVPNGVPTPHDLDSHIRPSELAPFSLPLGVRHSSLVPVPDTREPPARHLLLKDSKFTDHPRQAAAGKTTAREPKKTDFITRGIVVHEKVVPREDIMVDPPADAACGRLLLHSTNREYPPTKGLPCEISGDVCTQTILIIHDLRDGRAVMTHTIVRQRMAHPRDVRLVRAIALGRMVRCLPCAVTTYNQPLRRRGRQDACFV